MIGALPTTLEINGVEYEIRTDFRDVLKIIQAFHDDELEPRDKAYVLLAQTYKDLTSIPKDSIEEAYKKALAFVSCERGEPKPHKDKPELIDWEKDEMLIFPAINKVAGFEVRGAQYMHWWTFMGFFQGIDRDDTFGFVLSIRQKRAKHKKLEKYEQEFFNANRDICDLHFKTRKDVENELDAMYRDLCGD